MNEHAKKRQELEEAHDKIALQMNNEVPLNEKKNKIDSKNCKERKSLDEFKKIKEEYENNRAKGKGIFKNPITPRSPIVKKSNEQQLKEKLNKIRSNKNYLNRKPMVEIKPKPNPKISNLKPRIAAPLKRPSPLRVCKI